MSIAADIRKERIERLLLDLRYEIERGVLENDIGEEMTFGFVIPISRAIPDGVVSCQFRMRPMPRHAVSPDDFNPRLRVVK